MLGRGRRQLSNINPVLGQCLVFVGAYAYIDLTPNQITVLLIQANVKVPI